MKIAGAIALAALGACGQIVPLASTQVPASVVDISPQLSAQARSWQVVDVTVDVPQELTISEANRLYPIADIVWRAEPFGDRRAQVGQIVDDGMTRGLAHLSGPQPVIFDVTLSRFHSLSDKARVEVGGVHNLIFTFLVRDVSSGQVISGPHDAELGLRAFGGEQAVLAEQRGHDQKTRILAHLANMMRRSFGGIIPPEDAAAEGI